jgi:hypothetical protein
MIASYITPLPALAPLGAVAGERIAFLRAFFSVAD